MNVDQRRRDAEEISPDQVYDVLSHPYRRYVLQTLYQRPGRVDVRELASHVVAHEQDIPVCDVAGDDRDDALTSLHHNHLPRLHNAGLVEYQHADQSTAVELVGDIEPFEPALRMACDEPLRRYNVD